MKYNFSEVRVINVDGAAVEGATIHKALANAIYNFTTNLDLVETAMLINKGEEVELKDSEVEAIKKVIKDDRAGFLAFAQKTLLDYIAGVKV